MRVREKNCQRLWLAEERQAGLGHRGHLLMAPPVQRGIPPRIQLDLPVLDSIASVLIGLLLGAVAVALVYQRAHLHRTRPGGGQGAAPPDLGN